MLHFAMLLTVYLLATGIRGGRLVSAINLFAAAVIGPLVALYVGLNRYTPTVRTSEALLLTRPSGAQTFMVLLGLLVGASLAPLSNEVMRRILIAWPVPDLMGELSDQVLQVTPPGVLDWAAFGVFQLALSPFVEELFFRGFMQSRLARRAGVWKAVGVTALFYTAAQLEPRYMPSAAIVGLPLGILAACGKTTWAPIIGHVAHQVTQLWVSTSFGEDRALPQWLLWSAGGLSSSSLFLAWRFRRAEVPS